MGNGDKKQYIILKNIFNKLGVNDGLLFKVIDDSFNFISIHKTKELANKKIKILNKSFRKDNP